jgi:hypothetical protein
MEAKPVPVRRMARPYDYVIAFLFVTVWLAGILYKGLTSRDIEFLPFPFRDLHTVACLFTNRVGAWYQHYVGVRHVGSPNWYPVPMSELSQMNPFGYRTRIDWYLEGDPRLASERPRYEHLMEWTKNRLERLHPEKPPIAQVRLYRVYFDTGSELLANPDGNWVKPPPESIDPGEARVVHTMTFVEDGQ